ncbi:tetratricopeptide repeat protein [Roseivivax sp.]
MRHDICRAAVDFSDPEALAAWNAMTRSFLAHGAEAPDYLARVLERAPDAVLPLAAKGLFCLMLGRAETVTAAHEAARAARLRAGEGLPTRVTAWLAALEAWLSGQPSGALFHLEGVLVRTPEDTLTMKIVHGIRFILGDAGGMRCSLDRVIAAHDAEHPLAGFAFGCRAFALEETGDYDGAEASGLRALELAPDDAWGLHAVAHVYDMTHRPDRGIALIDENGAAWGHCNNFRYHVWWHKALLHLDRGEIDAVLALYDDKIRAEKTDDYRDIANASSLLMRLELEGVACGARWDELADLSEARSDDGVLVFADLHYLLALTGAGRPEAAGRLAGRIALTGQERNEPGRVAAHPGAAAARGLAAFGEGRYAEAFADLNAARAHMQTIGGSHAQRDIFERMTVDAGLRAGRLDACARILSERTRLRAGLPDAFADARRSAIDEARRTAALYAAQ